MSTRLRPLVAAALALVATVALGACSGSSGGNGDYKYKSATARGTLMPAADRKPVAKFDGTLLDGGKTKLSDTAGKVVIVNFWATWCGPCKVETPALDTFYRRMKAEGLTVVGIDTKDLRSQAKSFVAENRISYPIVYDQQGEAALTLGNVPANLPFSILLDKRGRVAAVYLGGLTGKDLQSPVDKLLAET